MSYRGRKSETTAKERTDARPAVKQPKTPASRAKASVVSTAWRSTHDAPHGGRARGRRGEMEEPSSSFSYTYLVGTSTRVRIPGFLHPPVGKTKRQWKNGVEFLGNASSEDRLGFESYKLRID